jgi:hypothetical protein
MDPIQPQQPPAESSAPARPHSGSNRRRWTVAILVVSLLILTPVVYILVTNYRYSTRWTAGLVVTAAALQVESYRLRHGRWPERLEELDPKPFPDPFSGQTLRYQRTEEGCLIHCSPQYLRNRTGDRGSLMIQTEGINFELFDPPHRNVKPLEPSPSK